MGRSGTWVIVAILGGAIAAAGGAWWHHRNQGQHCMAYWSSEGAYRIRHAATCELLLLAPTETSATPLATISFRGREWPVRARVDLSAARGMVHARQALILDTSYDWQTVPPNDSSAETWTHLLRFHDDQGETLVGFSVPSPWIAAEQPARQVALRPFLTQGFRTLFNETAAP